MANYTVDEFIIQLGFNENVSKNLQKLESRTLKVAERIEKNLNRAFTPKGDFGRVISSANNASKQINRAFSKSMNFDEAGKSSVKSVENAKLRLLQSALKTCIRTLTGLKEKVAQIHQPESHKAEAQI